MIPLWVSRAREYIQSALRGQIRISLLTLTGMITRPDWVWNVVAYNGDTACAIDSMFGKRAGKTVGSRSFHR